MIDLYAVILAGGSGTRLWPMSRQQMPKQFLCLDGELSLHEATVARLAPIIARDHVLIVANESSAKGEAFQPLAPYAKLLEPAARNTAPAIALAATHFRAWRTAAPSRYTSSRFRWANTSAKTTFAATTTSMEDDGSVSSDYLPSLKARYQGSK